jgi:hypothetical protein
MSLSFVPCRYAYLAQSKFEIQSVTDPRGLLSWLDVEDD